MAPGSTRSGAGQRPVSPTGLCGDYINESHIQAFADALQSEEHAGGVEGADSPTMPNAGTSSPPGTRIRKVSAMSDFAPINLKVRRRKRTSAPQQRRQEWLYLIVRWPLLGMIFLFIAVQFSLYVVIRQLVNAKEWLSAWRGRKGELRKKLRAARTYEEWKETALVLDEYLGFNDWKKVDEDPYYDWKLVRKVRHSLKTLRQRSDAHGVLGVLETCVRTNFAGVESSRLYSETFYGTKDLIEDYVTEEEKALQYIRDTPELSNEEKRRFFRSANKNFGISALCLSGGASFGYYHFGVIRALLDEGLLPRVVSGTSAGGLIAALVCTRTDPELKELLVPELANRITACEEPFKDWIKRFWRTGARFDSVLWARKACFFTRGSTTFREAYMRTGRILNVSVIPADRHSPTKLLNYMTAPDTVIWSAILASAAVPGILNPVCLMQKLKDGSIVPWSWGSKFKDGSLRVDIPVQALNMYFNVTHPIVSQVNPHVHLFFFAPQGSAGKPVAHRKGKGWRGNFLLSAAEQWLKLELTKNFRLIRDLDLLPQILGQDWSSVFLQRFDGAVTIWPRTRIRDFLHILTDPDPPELERMMRVGQLVTWPKLHMIENRFRIEKQILLGRQAVRKSSQTRAQDRAASRFEAMPQERLPTSAAGTKATTPSNPSLVSAVSDGPMPVDTDVETAYIKGSNGRLSRTPSTDKDDHAHVDIRHTYAGRRKWTSNLLNPNGKGDVVEQGDFGGATPDPPPTATDPEVERAHVPQGCATESFLKRLRRRASTAGLSPFAALRRNRMGAVDGHNGRDTEPAWSGDSSSEDDDLPAFSRRHSRHPSVFDLRSDMDRRYLEEDRADADNY
ncbi:patatin-domain-containing protein [Obba rivulosa]|uniref:Patatin-like phospholipase domain-containing protein n=1 Tax=Obba rivulosa TaxID=1052685 RepID=A0A8E2J3N5_9APHY|nr:patatin-domain-containing protein [Obba rivulosa]